MGWLREKYPEKFGEVIDLPQSIEGDVSKAIVAIAEVAIKMSEIISLGDLQSNLGREVGENSDGDNQKALDVLADEAFMKKLSSSSVSWYASEEQEEVVEVALGSKAQSPDLGVLPLLNELEAADRLHHAREQRRIQRLPSIFLCPHSG